MSCIKALKAVARRSNIFDPERVKGYLASAEMSENRKQTVVDHLARFYKWKDIPFDRPHYKRIELLPFMPTENEMDELISGLSQRWATFLQLMKETAFRCGEAWTLSWDDIDFKSRLVSVRHPEKGSQSRTLRVSQRLVDMLNILSRDSSCVFHEAYDDELKTMKGLESFRRLFERHRKRIAAAHPESNVAKIHFHSFRTWRATMEYLKTRDLEAVMMLLGATNPIHARRYVRLAQALTLREDDYVTARAATPDEAEELVREGFNFVTEIQGVQIFRRRVACRGAIEARRRVRR